MNRQWWGCGSRSDEPITATASFLLALQADVEVVRLYPAQCCPSGKKKKQLPHPVIHPDTSDDGRLGEEKEWYHAHEPTQRRQQQQQQAGAAGQLCSSKQMSRRLERLNALFTMVSPGGNVARQLQGFFHSDHLATATRSKRTQCSFTHKNWAITFGVA